jgi:hypothetical protein
MASVDWRNRFGSNWITSVRDQGPTENCWAFAVTALYEAMIRIEHCLWNWRSEGDVARGTGKQPWDIGNLGEAIFFVEHYGLADPDCFPWSTAAALYTSKPHGATMQPLPLAPTPDRVGRTMRIAVNSSTTLTDPAQQKQWIDLVGPMATIVRPPDDFVHLRGGIYVPTVQDPGPAHALLVVGFNDDEQCWIVKNSYGEGWGVGGFGKVSYNSATTADAGILQHAAFVGVRGTNPDPWIRRRMRNGVLVQGGNGALRNNFELFVRVGKDVEHWYRENADPARPWIRVRVVRSDDPFRGTFGDDVLDCPAAVQSTFNRNYELILRTTYRQLRHIYYDHTSGWWSDMTIFGPQDPVGIPGFIQSNRGAPGDFEVVVVTPNGHAEHWTKHNSAPWSHRPGEWYLREQFGSGLGYGGPSLVQSRLGAGPMPENGQGELHYVGAGWDGQLHHYRRPAGGGWQLAGSFGQGITSAPCLIEGTFGTGNESRVGNFELCVAAGDQVQHWWRHNASLGPWVQSAVFGADVRRVVGLLQGTFGFNMEMIVERTDGHYQHYWRDGAGWHAGPIIT